MMPRKRGESRIHDGAAANIRDRCFQAPARTGNRFALLGGSQAFFARMLATIDESKNYVLVEFYLVESGQVANLFIAAFIRAAARGVRVRLLFDGFGARGLSNLDRARLRSADIDLVLFNLPRLPVFPRMLVRNHRKLLIVDGAVGFTGGAGLADMFNPAAQPDRNWWDCMVEIEGPVLDDWQTLFERTWKRCANRELGVVKRSSAVCQPGECGRLAVSAGLGANDLGRAVINRVRKAERHVWIATAYFWPSIRLRRALRRAARRGVDVRMLLPGPNTDAPALRSVGRLFYARLLSSGVVIHEYQPSFLHTKLVLCDDWVSLGSCNLDRWGLLWNLDANQEVESPAFANQARHMLEQLFDRTLVLRRSGDVKHQWIAYLLGLLARKILGWSARAASHLRR